MLKPSAINQFETACVKHLEVSLNKNGKVRLWADVFNTSGDVRSKSQIYFGARNWVYQNTSYNPNTGKIDAMLLYTLDIQVILYTLHNHSDALNLIDVAMRSLSHYQPFAEFDPIKPVRGGDARYDRNNGYWVYNGEMSVLFMDNGVLSAIAPELPEPSIIQVGLFIDTAATNLQRDRLFS